ncbi:MAG: carbamoyl-phosphate synthase large subunit [Polyangiaceae bacterium]|nr:carbamoyl-phosphate synthase large subunit [Polyangiaceae bacterium]
MPRRDDLRKILLVGSGPIVIGQACEFDYSGTQGAKALRDDGYQIVLVNSNPATIMTDPGLAERTYVEPLEPRTLAAIIERERPDALLPTLGGQTALNLAMALHEDGTLARFGVELIGARPESIEKAESRQLFKEAMDRIGLETPRAGYAHTVAEACAMVEGPGGTGYPAIVRASFTLGGTGAGIANGPGDLEATVAWALSQSPRSRVLVEESLLGWKEFELEVMRDRADNFIVVCSIENIDPMGVHTGDSITVAPAMTLTDREYQRMRDAARAVVSEIGVETGGANVQFAVDPRTGRMVVIEMNPRVSRSSALASKATGYPIAKVSAKLAVGYRLDELTNDITGTSAAFEPTLDYVVVKWPRFSFEKFPGADTVLGTQMKSVGEAMAIGRTFVEALEKAARSLETGRDGMASLLDVVDYRNFAEDPNLGRDLVMDGPAEPRAPAARPPATDDELRAALGKAVVVPRGDRLFYVADALRLGIPASELATRTGIDPWFLGELGRLVGHERELAAAGEGALEPARLRASKGLGMSDRRIAKLAGLDAARVTAARHAHGIRPAFRNVDTCAAEFPARTPYMYSTYDGPPGAELPPSDRKKVVILGGGPNRIGQGIEFDYCCVHASFALRALGLETVMVNCNPETVSTDYDTSDRLYFEPLGLEEVLEICHEEQQAGELLGVLVQYGGQTPLKLAVALERAGIPLLGTPADAIDRAEDRERFDALLGKLALRRPEGDIAGSIEEARVVAARIGFPVLVRPSYVLGGRAMMICYNERELAAYMHIAVEAAREAGTQRILVDRFLKDAIEVDVDAVGDGQEVAIGGVMQHIEEAGVHSGDSACVLPPYSLAPAIVASIEEQARQLGRELGVIGLMNVQFAVKGDEIYVIEVNPRAARTVPFVSKATGRPLAKIAAELMAGHALARSAARPGAATAAATGIPTTLAELGFEEAELPAHVAVKESVFPFIKLPGVDTQLGPEMRSTGEVMGVARVFARAYGKALRAGGIKLPRAGRAFVSVRDDDKPAACVVARRLRALGFAICATAGTAAALHRARIPAETLRKVAEGSPHVVDAIRGGTIQMIVNTTEGAKEIRDSYSIRRGALHAGIPYFTTLSAALAGVAFLEADLELPADALPQVRSLQEWHAG